MKLGERLKQATIALPAAPSGLPEAPEVAAAVPATSPTRAKHATEVAVEPRGSDPVTDLKRHAQQELFGRLGSRLYDSSLSEADLKSFVVEELRRIVDEGHVPLSPSERDRLVGEIGNDVLGYGPIEAFLADPTVTEVMVNSLEDIYVERSGQLHRTNARFLSEQHLRRVIERIVSEVGRRIDESSPMVDARLPDGSRVNAIIPPLAVDGPALTVRKFSKEPYQVDDLIAFGTMTAEMATLLSACVAGRLNILISGGTGTGKTTLLNVLSSFIPDDERIVTVEDAVELQLRQHHVVRLESRPANIEGRGGIPIRELVRNCLRMRPDRIVVGEVRGGEALDMLQAMNTGHDGSLSTVHANTPRDALARVETMVLMAGLDLPARAIREQVASALDLIVHVTRLRDGTRRVTHVTEIDGMEGQTVTMQDIFLFDYTAGLGQDGRFLGSARPTGIRPKFAQRLAELGIYLPYETFGVPDVLAASHRADVR